MYKFDTVKKGYDKVQVDNYINREIDSYKQTISDKNMRI